MTWVVILAVGPAASRSGSDHCCCSSGCRCRRAATDSSAMRAPRHSAALIVVSTKQSATGNALVPTVLAVAVAAVLAARGGSMLRLLVCGGAVYALASIVVGAALRDERRQRHGAIEHGDGPHHVARPIRGDGRRRAGGRRHWTRRHAAALVKVLALAPGRRLHREQIIDLLWPDDTIDEAAPKLHKAAHFARRAHRRAELGGAAGRQRRALPDADPTVDVVRFEELARRRSPTRTSSPLARRWRSTAASCCRRTATSRGPRSGASSSGLRHLDLLRLDGRWETVVELDEGDELAHLALMRRHAANGDRHAALRQFERMDRALRRELGVAPGREALALRDRLLAEHDVVAAARRRVGRSRAASCRSSSGALLDAAAGRSRTLIVVGPGRRGQVVAARRDHRPGEGAELPGRARHVGPGRGRVAVRAGGRGARRRVPAASDAARRPARPSPRGDRPRARRRRDARGRAAARTSGCSSPRPSWSAWRRRPTACCSPSTTSTTPTTPACACCTTSPARRATSGCASCSPTGRRR